MLPVDYSTWKGCATEAEWDRFVYSQGGERVTDRVVAPDFDNADYLFPAEKVIAELKIIETEFGQSKQIARASRDFVTAVEFFGEKDFRSLAAYRRVLNAMRKPLSAIAKKANRQIRETKRALDLDDWKGVFLCVNDNFRMVTPKIVQGLLARILNGSMSSVDATVYLTNHYVEFPQIPFASLVWAPMYRDETDDHLSDFINRLGEGWGRHSENVLGPFDVMFDSDELTLNNVMPVSSATRHYSSGGAIDILPIEVTHLKTPSGLLVPRDKKVLPPAAPGPKDE